MSVLFHAKSHIRKKCTFSPRVRWWLCLFVCFGFYIGRTTCSPLHRPIRVTPATLFILNIHLLFPDCECSRKNKYICASVKDYPSPFFLFSAQPFLSRNTAWARSGGLSVNLFHQCKSLLSPLKSSVIAKTCCILFFHIVPLRASLRVLSWAIRCRWRQRDFTCVCSSEL